MYKYGKLNKLTYNFEDRITALEKKSTQGATLSPVKLWSGSASASVTVPGAEKYNLLYCKSNFRSYGSFVIRNADNGISDDIGSGTWFSSIFKITDNIVSVGNGGNWIKLFITEIWGIG